MTELNSDYSSSPIEIRENLKSWIKKRFHVGKKDIFINELGFYNRVPDSIVDRAYRADLVLANGRLVGFEIKSEKDSLKRWQSQILAYTNVFDEVWLCTHTKHLEKALQDTPKHIGIILVDNFDTLAVARKSVKNHGMNNVYDLTGLLWRDEINELAKIHEIKITSRTTKKEAREILAQYLSITDVRGFILEKLKLRKS